MKKYIILIIALLSISVLLAACNRASVLPEEPVVEEPGPVEIPEEPEPEPEPEPEIPAGVPSPLSGLYADEELVEGRIMAIIFDNHPAARWQAGLKDAEVIYEYPVEGTFTRYMGLYLIGQPEGQIGPIRSARPYFVTKAYEFDAIFVHVGGSEAAKSDAKKLKIAEIDGLNSSPKIFWRFSEKKAPNNLYSSMEMLRQTQEERGYRDSSEFEGFIFDYDDITREGEPAKKVEIIYNKSNRTDYTYDDNLGKYLRYKDGKPHIDESDETQLTADNIIVQRAGIKVLDNEGRLAISVEGSGTGYYISQRYSEEITWEKKERSSKTYYYNTDGDEIVLKPGQTWIQIVGMSTSVEME